MTIVLQRCDETDTTEHASGFGALQCEHGNLPLKQLAYHTSVIGLSQRSTIVQTFYNPFDQSIEAVYIFPIEGGQAVVGCEMRVAERVIRARLKERRQARAEYQQAIQSGYRAALLEENRSETFSMRVGNIPPGEAIQVRIETISQMPIAYGEWTLRIPLVIAPRFTSGIALPGNDVGPGTANDTDQVPDASTVTPPTWLPGFASPVELQLSVELQMGDLVENRNWIEDLRSSLHAVLLTRETSDGDTTKCKVQVFPGERVNRDFILRGKIDDSQLRTAACIETDSTDTARSTIAIHIVPPHTENRMPRDVIFLLDHSGSMSGWKMMAARRGISRLVDALLPCDRFQVLAFDDSIMEFQIGGSLFVRHRGWHEASDKNRYEAVRWLGNVDSAGGTQMGMAIDHALGQFSSGESIAENRSPAIVLVTDGQITGEDSVMQTIGAIPLAIRPRIYCLGVDRAVNGSILKRITDFTGGTYELVESENRLSEVLQRFGGEIGMPAVRDLSVQFDSSDYAVLAPGKPCNLYTGKSLTIYARGSSSSVRSISLRGKLPDGQPWIKELEVRPSDSTAPVLLPLWAKTHIHEMEDQLAARGDRDTATIEKIVACSTQCGVLSRMTAFIAVDESEKVTSGKRPHSITQPAEFPEGWQLNAARLRNLIPVPLMRRFESFEPCRIGPEQSEHIARILVSEGTISNEQFEEAYSSAQRANASVLDKLTSAGYVGNEDVAKAAAKASAWHYVDPESLRIPDEVIQLVPESVARENCMIPIRETRGVLEVLVCDPYDFDMIEGLQFIFDRPIVANIASSVRIQEAINRYYGQAERESADSMLQEFTDTQIDFCETEEDRDMEAGAAMPVPAVPILPDGDSFDDGEEVCMTEAPLLEEDPTPGRVRSFARGAARKLRSSAPVSDQASEMQSDSEPIVRLVNYLIAEAVQLRASHVILELEQGYVKILNIINGQSVMRDQPPQRLFRLIVARLKSMAKLGSDGEDLQSWMINVTVGQTALSIKVYFADDSVLLELEEAKNLAATPQPVVDWWESYAGRKV